MPLVRLCAAFAADMADAVAERACEPDLLPVVDALDVPPTLGMAMERGAGAAGAVIGVDERGVVSDRLVVVAGALGAACRDELALAAAADAAGARGVLLLAVLEVEAADRLADEACEVEERAVDELLPDLPVPAASRAVFEDTLARLEEVEVEGVEDLTVVVPVVVPVRVTPEVGEPLAGGKDGSPRGPCSRLLPFISISAVISRRLR